MRPSFIFPYESSHLPVTSQTWQKSGSCPEGSVPIRRVGRQELLRAASLDHFGRDGRPPSQAVNTKSDRFIYHNGTKIAMIPKADHSVIKFNDRFRIFWDCIKILVSIFK